MSLKFKAQPTNAIFATINQMFGRSSQLTTTAERMVIKSLCTIQAIKQWSAVIVSWEDPPNIWLTAAKNAFVGQPSNFRVRMLLKSVVVVSRACNAWSRYIVWKTLWTHHHVHCSAWHYGFELRDSKKCIVAYFSIFL